MGKRTIKKKRNTRKRNTLKRKKNTLKKNTFKRKKINLRKLGGYPVGFSDQPNIKEINEDHPHPLLLMDKDELKALAEKLKLNPPENSSIEDLISQIYKNPSSIKRVARKYKENSGISDEDFFLLKRRYDKIKAQYDDTITLDTAYREYLSNKADLEAKQKLVKLIENYEEILKPRAMENFTNKLREFLKNKNKSFYSNTLLCDPGDLLSKQARDILTMEKLLDRIMAPNFISNIENVKHRIRKKTEYTISKEKLINYMGNLFTDKPNYPSQISLRWSELRKKSKQMKSALTISQYSMIEGLEKSNKCFDRVVNINKFLEQFKKLTVYHVDYCMDILFS